MTGNLQTQARHDPTRVDPLRGALKMGCLALAAAVLSGCTSYHGRGIQYQLKPQYGVDDPQFRRSMEELVGPGIVGGNRVTSLVNGDQIFPAMLESIQSAKKTINLESYIYWSGDVGRKFTDALVARSKAGVRVHVLLDWIGSRKIDSQLLSAMRAAGVEVQKYNPLVWYNLARLNHRDHRKLLIIDGAVGFIGGAGVADIWLGNADSPAHWRDTHFKLEGPAVAQMQSAFMDNWMKTTSNVLDGADYFPELQERGSHYAQVVHGSPRDGIESVRLMYLLSIAAARKSIRLSVPYFVPGQLMTEQLLDARKRGVTVEIIVPGARTDTPIVRHASRSKWGPLLAAGVRIYEYQPTMYHCKIMIVDDVWVSVGSANFDSRSFRLNDESNLNVLASEFAAEQARLFEGDKKLSREVNYRGWQRRSVGKRFWEMLAAPFHSHL